MPDAGQGEAQAPGRLPVSRALSGMARWGPTGPPGGTGVSPPARGRTLPGDCQPEWPAISPRRGAHCGSLSGRPARGLRVASLRHARRLLCVHGTAMLPVYQPGFHSRWDEAT
jgi:hypothetical protein